MHKNTALALLGTFLVFMGKAANAHWTPFSACERMLGGFSMHEKLVDEAADFELRLAELEGMCRGEKCLIEAQTIHAEFITYIDDLLEGRLDMAELIRVWTDLTSREAMLRARVLSKESSPQGPQKTERTILQFTEDTKALPANEPVSTGNSSSFIRTVVFAHDILWDFWALALHQQAKFLRAIWTGVVGPVGESGVKFLPHVSKNLVEVKAFGTGARLYGCLKGGKLTILKMTADHVSLGRYRTLCD